MKFPRLKKGHVATVWHEGTKAFYEATITRHVPQREFEGVLKASCGEDPRPDQTIAKEVAAQVFNCDPSEVGVFNDATQVRRRFKFYGRHVDMPTKRQMDKLALVALANFGDRFVGVGVSMYKEPWIRITR
jgi:hypothetical protein